ncbi:hypothetical protein AC53_2267 [Escherichia coli 7-233-03_S3_C3]|nr:hypothetical protein AC53_2267 [Escherichia coli 7-233-03_S3_C3]
MAFHLDLRHTQLPKHIDTAPSPAPPWLNKIYQRLFQPTPKCISL